MMCPLESRDDLGLLLDYSAGNLDEEMMVRVARHVEECPACREAVGGQRAVSSALDAWAPAPVSADFNRRLYQRIDQEAVRAGWWRKLFPPMPRFRPAMPMAAMFLVLVATFLFRTPDPVVVDNTAAVESIDVDQLENVLDDMEMLRQLGVMPAEDGSDQAL